MDNRYYVLSLPAVALGMVLSGATVLHAQEPADPSVERIKRSLSTPPPIAFNTPLPPLIDTPDVKRFGIFTLEPPDYSNGQFVRIGIPIGELIMRGVSGIASAHHRRLERKAREEVRRALAEFESQK